MNFDQEIIVEFSFNYDKNPFYPSKSKMLKKIYEQTKIDGPSIQSTVYMEKFITLPYISGDTAEGIFIIGPYLDSDTKKESIMRKLSSNRQNSEIENYLTSLARLDGTKDFYILMQLYYMIHNEQIELNDIIHNKNHIKIEELQAPDMAISKGRREFSLHHTQLYERKFLQAVQKGDAQTAIKEFRSTPDSGKTGVLSKRNLLRGRKNLGIVIIALMTREVMKNGVHNEVAYTLSDLHIQNLEELDSQEEVDHALETAIIDFTSQVAKKTRLQYSVIINQCVSYVFKNLYDDLTLGRLAETVNVHPNYLSALFKKETGMNLKDYIQEAKVEESKLLITSSDYSLLEISTLLNFHDQSYFTRVFKKHTGLTPKKFRNAYSIL
ncbi:helix-turn-helix domain-containing protein [Salinicoccus sesuvii]|uniref:Helix-turn-helix domain-containing protein n=1 Tax=Salinicoccus sesuvii TaxID=868281 RepID=A0ABV7N2G3_9STAP